jgi:hypothetical protein
VLLLTPDSFPTLTATLGYSQIVTLLLVAPPWAFAAIMAFANARLADKCARPLRVLVRALTRDAGISSGPP